MHCAALDPMQLLTNSMRVLALGAAARNRLADDHQGWELPLAFTRGRSSTLQEVSSFVLWFAALWGQGQWPFLPQCTSP